MATSFDTWCRGHGVVAIDVRETATCLLCNYSTIPQTAQTHAVVSCNVDPQGLASLTFQRGPVCFYCTNHPKLARRCNYCAKSALVYFGTRAHWVPGLSQLVTDVCLDHLFSQSLESRTKDSSDASSCKCC